MHLSVFKPSTSRSRVVRLVACVLLPAFSPEVVASSLHLTSSRAGTTRTPPQSLPVSPSDALPYLAVTLPPPLRFAEPLPPAADPVSSVSVPHGPGHPAGLVEEIGALNQQAAMAASGPASGSLPSAAPGSTGSAPPTTIAPAPAPGVPVPTPLIASGPSTPPPAGVSILPDPTPRAIRAEDVLIYFQYPASSPSSGLPPPSSATFQQQ